MKIIVPMAGKGTRFAEKAFQNPEYLKPKPLISLKGYPMIQWSLACYYPYIRRKQKNKNKPLKFSDFIFVCLQEHEDDLKISTFLKEIISRKINIVLIPEVTRGPAETALAAREFVDNDESLIVSDSDNFPAGREFMELVLKVDDEMVGILPVTKPINTPSWSYAVCEGPYVTKVAEKDLGLFKKGVPGIVGCYFFTRGRDFVKECKKMIAENDKSGQKGKEEFYMSQIYNRMLKKGKKVGWVWVDEYWDLGTPELAEKFVLNCRMTKPFGFSKR